MGEQILGLMVYCIPALVTGVIAFLFLENILIMKTIVEISF